MNNKTSYEEYLETERQIKKLGDTLKCITLLRAELLKLGYDFDTLTIYKEIKNSDIIFPYMIGGLKIQQI